jgi:hypothetical protein
MPGGVFTDELLPQHSVSERRTPLHGQSLRGREIPLAGEQPLAPLGVHSLLPHGKEIACEGTRVLFACSCSATPAHSTGACTSWYAFTGYRCGRILRPSCARGVDQHNPIQRALAW